MTKKEEAIKIIWDYMHLGHQLENVDLIVVLGSHDKRVAKYAAELWHRGLAPLVVFSGSGTIHEMKPAWKDFVGSTEAEVFAKVAIEAGVPKEAIIIENQSQNTGDNLKFTKALLAAMSIDYKKVILVQKPFMERRTYATAMVQWPDVELLVTSPAISCEDYATGMTDEWWIHALVGDLQRIKEYPKLGFQIEQEIPDEVWAAYEYLVELGYNDNLLK